MLVGSIWPILHDANVHRLSNRYSTSMGWEGQVWRDSDGLADYICNSRPLGGRSTRSFEASRAARRCAGARASRHRDGSARQFRTSDPESRLRLAAPNARQIHDTQSATFDLMRGAGVVAPELAKLEQQREPAL